jgi:hypothetical protein
MLSLCRQEFYEATQQERSKTVLKWPRYEFSKFLGLNLY